MTGHSRGAAARRPGASLACRAVLILCCGLAGACAHYPDNEPIDAIDATTGYRIRTTAGDLDDSRELLMVLTFSGGGVRASALAYGVLEVLRDTLVEFDGRERALLDEIDIISSVSGGSITAAYYGLHGKALFDDFPERFLYRDVQGGYVLKLLAPWNWARLLSPYYGRGDLLAEHLDKALFDGGTFADMRGEGTPAIVINATDITQGTRFGFTQDDFDLLCSNLSTFKVARAVAASAAVPGFLSPISLVNYPASRCAYRPPAWMEEVLADGDLADRRYQEASKIANYVVPDGRRYVHLLDGGLADNLGLRLTIERTASAGSYVGLIRASGFSRFRRIVHMVVNAQADPGVAWSQSERPPGWLSTLIAAPGVTLNRYTFETVETFLQERRRWLHNLRQYRCTDPESQFPASICDDVQSYFVEVSFARHPDPDERDHLQALSGTKSLGASDVDRVRAAARTLLENSPEFRRLLSDLQALRPPVEELAPSALNSDAVTPAPGVGAGSAR